MAKLISSDGNVPKVPVICSSGIEVLVKPISLMLLERFDLEHQEPKPPMVETEIIGGAIELVEDYEDPAYKDEMEKYTRGVVTDLLNLVVSFAVEVELPEDDAWLYQLETAGIEIDEDEELVSYVQYVVMIDTVTDLKKIMSQTFMLSGVAEEAIQSWVDLF